MAMVTPGELYVVVIINLVSGDYDINSEVFTNWDAADAHRRGLNKNKYLGVVRKVTINYS